MSSLKIIIVGWEGSNPRGTKLFYLGSNRLKPRTFSRLYSVDAATGNRNLLSGPQLGVLPGRGIGPGLDGIGGSSLVANGSQLLILSYGLPGLISVDIVTGDRTVLADSSIGVGPDFPYSMGLFVNATETAAYVSGFLTGELLRVDLATGDRVLLSGPALGVGPALVQPTGLVVNAEGTQAFVISDGKELMRVDLATGDRTLLFTTLQGNGDFEALGNLVASEDFSRLYIVGAALSEYDIATNVRRTLSSSAVGSGVIDFSSRSIRLNAAETEAYIHDSGAGLLRIDLATGDKFVISN